VIFNSFAQESKFNLFGSKEIFALSPVVDASILGTSVSLVATDFILEKTLKQPSSNFPDKVFNKDNLSGIDKMIIKPYSKTLDDLGTVGAFALLSSPLMLLIEPKEEWFTIGTMYVESVLLAYALKDFGKVLVNKPRPYMYNNTYPQKEIESGDWNKSFPSGHTTLAFTGAAYTSYVFSKYNPSSSWKWPVIVSSYALASTVGILRVASGNHFITDVLCGAAIGTCCGIVVPFLHTLNAKINSESNTNRIQTNFSPFSVDFLVRL
jgi:undecaprenyl-diphosphatase